MDRYLRFIVAFLCCVLAIHGCSVSVPKQTIVAPILSQTILQWNMTDSPQVWLAVSRNNGAEYFLNTIVPNTGIISIYLSNSFS